MEPENVSLLSKKGGRSNVKFKKNKEHESREISVTIDYDKLTMSADFGLDLL